ncbi:uncharacterized protein LOC110859463 [Folsomia candida]|uniref:uncharacterized protein LOC110859463 n=1 Tax=Folsomia candida TaxID=158441 RepID=UPI001604E6FA|nr:uncharacterized protein LOC110859463 [Folsomia candida]
MKSTWKLRTEWDQIVPEKIQNTWNQFKIGLQDLKLLKIPRSQTGHASKKQNITYLIGFSDASEEAYSAVVYLVSYDAHGYGLSYLIASKTRVAPLQKQSLPRLELCGALLLSEFMPQIAKALKIHFKSMIAYTDSTLVLRWIRSEPYKYHTFVANRISKIQENLPAEYWGFVRGVENPADCASRGITVKELINHQLWWNGPNWLVESIPKPEVPEEFHQVSDPKEEKRENIVCQMTAIKTKQGQVSEKILSCGISTTELDGALKKWISIAQQQEFTQEILQLQNKEKLSTKSRLLPLNPFLDKDHILRVGGRLKHAEMPTDQKYPILLPQYHRVTYLIIENAHLSNLHGAPQVLLSFLQQKYWIVRGKDVIRKVIRKCIMCTRLRAETLQQIMANLPAFRVNPSKAFKHTGLDYAGPYLIRPISPRSKITLKAYLCIFICCTTRAIHLEVVSDATTQAFLAALRRFVARRGKPADIYSDNGTNFVGAEKQLKEFIKLSKSNEHNQKVFNTLSEEGITWHFNPPAAPHFGGLWESGVKSTKFHLKRIMGLQRLTFEELSTLTCQIEAVLNSRPLTPESTDPTDLRALTSGHFLIGQALTSVPDSDLSEVPVSRLIRWQLIQNMLQQFWKRWSAEYLTRMQARQKWLVPVPSIKLGSLVIIKDDNTPPLKWSLGRIIKLHPGEDQQIRTVTVKTASGELKRPIVKICLLPVDTTNTKEENSERISTEETDASPSV